MGLYLKSWRQATYTLWNYNNYNWYLLVALPIKMVLQPGVGLIIIWLICAPVYPSIIHATPSNFGAENSQAIIGIQMASVYTGLH